MRFDVLMFCVDEEDGEGMGWGKKMQGSWIEWLMAGKGVDVVLGKWGLKRGLIEEDAFFLVFLIRSIMYNSLAHNIGDLLYL